MFIPESLVDKLYIFLSANKYDGIRFFEECLLDNGSLSPVFIHPLDNGHTIPHPVHFREGMQIRNFLRTCEECESWSDHDYDNFWESVVAKTLIKHRIIILKKLENNEISKQVMYAEIRNT